MDLRNPKQIRREYRARFAAIALGFAIAALIGVTVTKASGNEIERQIDSAHYCGAC
jgi:hypothetical protein